MGEPLQTPFTGRETEDEKLAEKPGLGALAEGLSLTSKLDTETWMSVS